MISFTLRPRYSRENRPRYPLYRRQDGPRSQSGRCEEEKSPCSFRKSNPCPVRSLTELPRHRQLFRSQYSSLGFNFSQPTMFPSDTTIFISAERSIYFVVTAVTNLRLRTVMFWCSKPAQNVSC